MSMQLDGTNSRRPEPSRMDRVIILCKRYIAEEFREHGHNVSEEGVELDGTPQEDFDTFDLLMDETLEHRADQRLNRLLCVWSVKGKHRDVPNVRVELLIGEYKGFHDFARLGNREGLKWVSAIS
jgi:hypothetical protein